MSGNANQKTKILYLMKILMEETDELHPLTIKELVTKLDQYNIQAERKSLYNDKKFESFGFEVIKIDGHDFNQIESALEKAKTVKGKPTAILAKTIKGKGVSFMENQVGWHGTAPNKEQYEQATAELQAEIDRLEGNC